MSKLIVALDTSDFGEAMTWVNSLRPQIEWFKIGLQLFLTAGNYRSGHTGLIREIKKTGAKIFLDLKFHDIPNTVRGAIKSISTAHVDMVNVHASGGRKMMRAATIARDEYAPDMKLLAVTVLTSLDVEDVKELNMPVGHAEQLAKIAIESGLDGVIGSAHELRFLRRVVGDGLIVTPGIRPGGEDAADQVRVATPAQAVRNGADFLVVGRPITQADDPLNAAEQILDEMKSANKETA